MPIAERIARAGERITEALRDFLRLESAGGILLVLAALIAIILANSPLNVFYEWLLAIPVTVTIGELGLSKPLLLWINDGLMAVFFLLVGLEIKREMLEGELSSRDQACCPLAAALGGMPRAGGDLRALNRNDGARCTAGRFPTATDIAFALGVLSLLGSRVPLSLKVFLLALAIIDDLGAIIIIAVFYTGEPIDRVTRAGAVVARCCSLLNRRGSTRSRPTSCRARSVAVRS